MTGKCQWRLQDFLYGFSLQVGVVYVCCWGMGLSVIAFLKLCYNPMTETDSMVAAASYSIAAVFILASFLAYTFGLAGSALENSLLLKIAGGILICVAVDWCILTTMSFTNNCKFLRYVCVDNRCTERLYIQNGYWRTPIALCQYNESATSPVPERQHGFKIPNATEPTVKETVLVVVDIIIRPYQEPVTTLGPITSPEPEIDYRTGEQLDYLTLPSLRKLNNEDRNEEQTMRNFGRPKRYASDEGKTAIGRETPGRRVEKGYKHGKPYDAQFSYELASDTSWGHVAIGNHNGNDWKYQRPERSEKSGPNGRRNIGERNGNNQGKESRIWVSVDETTQAENIQYPVPHLRQNNPESEIVPKMSSAELNGSEQSPSIEPDDVNSFQPPPSVILRPTCRGLTTITETDSNATTTSTTNTTTELSTTNDTEVERELATMWTPIGNTGTNSHWVLSVIYAVLILPLWYVYPIWLIFSMAAQIDHGDVV